MSVFLAVALIFCMVIPSYAVVAEGILIYKGITISAAAIKTLLVWSGVTIGAVAVTGAAVDNADKIAYTASAIWEDIKQSATTAATTVKDWVTSWTSSATDADTLEYTTPVTKTWTAAEIQSVVDAFREYLSLSTTTSATGEKILNIRTLEATYTITASKTYIQDDTVFTATMSAGDKEFVAFPASNTTVQSTGTKEQAETAVQNFISAMTNRGIQVVKYSDLPTETASYIDTLKVRFSDVSIWDVGLSESSASDISIKKQYDNVWETSDGKKIVNAIPLLIKSNTRYPTVYAKNKMLNGEEDIPFILQEGVRQSGYRTNALHYESYVAAIPYISYSRRSTTTQDTGFKITSDGYASIMILMLTMIADSETQYRLIWRPLSIQGYGYDTTEVNDGVMKNADVSVPMDCDVTIMTETGTLVNADEVQKEVPIVGIEDGVTVPADVLTGDVSITLPTTSDVTLGDTLVNDQTTVGTLTDAGVKTDSVAIDTATTADPSVPGGDGSGGVEFPTGVFDGIWKYVVHLVEKGSSFIGFLGDCLSCIPQEVSWCFYGGLVLLIFGAVLSKMLL